MRLATVIISASPLSDSSALPGEDARGVGERLELQRVAARVEEEHRGLLARLTFEAYVGLDDEPHAGAAHAPGQLFELRGREDDAEVRHGDVAAVHGVRRLNARAPRLEVRHDLVAEEVEVD